MTKTPPHLPAKTCNVKTHQRMQLIWQLILIVIISFLAGISAALATVAWFAPPAVPGESLLFRFIDKSNDAQNFVVDPLVKQQTKQRVMRIYDAAKQIDPTILRENTLVTEAQLLSSDGWAVVHMPDYVAGDEKKWFGVDSQGVVHKLQSVSFDPWYGFVYFQFEGDGFRVASFARDEQLFTGMNVWVINEGQWMPYTLFDVGISNVDAYRVWQLQTSYLLESNGLPPEPGSVVVNQHGELLGFVDEKFHILPSWPLEEQLSQVLGGQEVTYKGFMWKGFPIIASFVDGVVEDGTGFYITALDEAGTAVGLRVGDIIRSYDGKSFNEVTFARDVLLGPERSILVIDRANERIELEVAPYLLIIDN